MLVALGLQAAPALAQPASKKIVVRPFEGPEDEARRVRAAVLMAVSQAKDLELLSLGDVKFRGRMIGASVDDEAGRAKLAMELGIHTWVEGEVEGEDDDWEVEIVFLSATGDEQAEAEFEAKSASGLEIRVRDKLWPEVGTRVSPAAAEAVVARERQVEMRKQAEEQQRAQMQRAAAERRAAARRPRRSAAPPMTSEGPIDVGDDTEVGTLAGGFRYTPLVVALKLRPQGRSLAYADALPGLFDYDHAPTPLLELDARWFPYAAFGGIGGDVGLDLRAMIPIGLIRSETPDGAELETTTSQFQLGVRGRIAVGEHEVGVVGGVALHDFSLEEEDGMEVLVPDATYTSVRVGGDAHFEVYRGLTLGLAAFYMRPLSFGQLGNDDWYPRISAHAMELEGRVGYWLADTIRFEMGGGVQAYFLSMNMREEDPAFEQRASESALDFYPSFYGGISGRLPGS